MPSRSKNPEWQAHLWIETPLRETTAAVLASPSQGRPCIVKSYAEVPEMRLLGLIQTAPSIGAAADLLRLEVVYRYGGIYMDVDSHPVHGFEEYGSLFRWPFVTYAGSGGGLCNCLFSDSPGSAFLNFTIAAAYEIGTTFKIRGPLTATGPPLVNSAFVMYNNPEYVLIESDFVLKHRKKDKEIMYQSFDFSWAGVPGGPPAAARMPEQ
ncbi:unnamed protein product [Prorocentrum cordatum]|uniref:Alpha-1,4-N-acetylglucosaminyltransferase n=2 Tax=Prorocentrum cordatum TaxID=2364126 RepID=A0ABN9XLD4_9DINO|nr:unnamed protein product [Polarella glacialis]